MKRSRLRRYRRRAHIRPRPLLAARAHPPQRVVRRLARFGFGRWLLCQVTLHHLEQFLQRLGLGLGRLARWVDDVFADVPFQHVGYVQRGERPTVLQIITFGAAGGLIPCPAAVTVMLPAVSVNKTGNGLVMVLGFSLGLALTLVAIGLAVVKGLSALGSSGRFGWFSRRAGVISAAVVMVSGAAALGIAVFGGGHH